MNTQKEDFNSRILEILDQTGLNWEVSKEKLKSEVDDAATSAYGIFKKTERSFLAAVGSRYTPFQNWQLAQGMLIATDKLNMPITNGGQLNGGGKVYLQAQLPDAYVGRSGIKRHLTGLASHDGTGSIGFGSSNTVVICQNTYYRAYDDLKKVRHTMSADERIKVIAEELNSALLKDEKLITMFKTMADTDVNEDIIQKVINKIFDVDSKETKAAELSSRKKNQILAFGDAARIEFGLQGRTIWGLFNSVTRFTNHTLAPKDKGREGVLSYLMDGRGYELSNITFDLLAKEIGIKDKELSLG